MTKAKLLNKIETIEKIKELAIFDESSSRFDYGCYVRFMGWGFVEYFSAEEIIESFENGVLQDLGEDCFCLEDLEKQMPSKSNYKVMSCIFKADNCNDLMIFVQEYN